MNIQNIQIAQSLFRTVEERLNARKEQITGPSDASLPQLNVPEAEDQTVDTPKVLRDENLLEVVYPPFFPIGSTQDILSIEGVRQLAGDDAKADPSDAVEEQKAIQQREINHKATNTDAGVMRRDHAQSTDAPPKDKTPSAHQEANPGVVLDLRV